MKGLETPLTEYKLNYIYLNLDYINYLSTLLENIEKLNYYCIWLSLKLYVVYLKYMSNV